MKNDDYGFYGKGLDGYVHYRQGMQEAARNAPNASGGRRPVSAEQKTTEPAPKSDESGQISKWILQHPLHTAVSYTHLMSQLRDIFLAEFVADNRCNAH